MKMYLIASLLIGLFLLAGCNNKEKRFVEIISTYPNGHPKLEYQHLNSLNDTLNYDEFEYYPNGKVSFEGQYRFGKEQGIFIWRFKNGNIQSKQKYTEGIMVDTTYCYYESGHLKRKVNPHVMEPFGAVEYYESGEKKIETYLYHSDYIDSNWTGFYRNGRIKEQGLIHKGAKVGIWSFYDSTGRLINRIDQSGIPKTVFDFEEFKE